MTTKYNIGKKVYTVNQLCVNQSEPYIYKIYVSEKTISKIVITHTGILYVAGNYDECVFMYDGGKTAKTVKTGNCISQKTVYFTKKQATEKMKEIIASDPSTYIAA